jgi:indole-3-glycerol phosphate synthase
LVKFRQAKAAEIDRLTRNPPRLEDQPAGLARPDFLASLRQGQAQRGLALIAEYKRASPSLGDIDLALSPHSVVAAYAAAEAISVLTEETYFKGRLSFLAELAPSGQPLLRKDFIFEPAQLLETALYPASAVLLIVRLTPRLEALAGLINLALSLGLCPVVEIFDPRELALAREAGARVIQVNARDLETLKVDPLGPIQLIKKFPPQAEEFWIAASGLAKAADLARVRAAGFGAALIGSALMASGDPGAALAELIKGLVTVHP